MAANETPADTRMMGIVHAALKRDLSRVGTALHSSPVPAGRQRSALAAQHAEWRAVEQAYNIKAKSLSQLGIEGQWLLDGIDAAGYRVVTQTVPTVARLVLLYGFGRRYRRQARERWEPDPSPTVAGRR